MLTIEKNMDPPCVILRNGQSVPKSNSETVHTDMYKYDEHMADLFKGRWYDQSKFIKKRGLLVNRQPGIDTLTENW